MLSIVRRKRRSAETDPDDEDEAGTPPSSAESATSARSKRIRTLSSKRSAGHANGFLPNGRMPQVPTGISNGAGHGAMSHQPGSIVRMKLTNFVTYTAVEVFPGPSLNMVIGPNGTGKSTMVCAICLGLGWGPQHLGRARDVGEFVKHGAHEATIEIELRADGTHYRRNPVVRCLIKRETNKCTYSLNGKPAGKKQVLAAARSLAIQVDNLCQFLPQDKVVEFAAMTPVELLRSTQRAVASPEMIDGHEKLKEIRRVQREIERKEKEDREELAGLENRQRMQEADVERLRERETVKQNVEYLEAARPIARYRDANKRFKSVKAERNEVSKELAELEDAVQPAMRAVNAKQAYRDAVKVALDNRLKKRDQVVKTAQEALDKVDELGKEIERSDKSVEKETTRATVQRQEELRIEGNIKRLKKQLAEPPGEFDVGAMNDQIRERQRNITAVEDAALTTRTEMERLKIEGKAKGQEIEAAQKEVKNLDSQAGRQMVKLSHVSHHAYTAWKWVQEHQDQFEKHVYGPPLVECSVKDPKYVNLLETIVQSGDMTSIIAQTKNDYAKLHRALHGDLKLTHLNLKTVTDPLERHTRPDWDAEKMKRHNFDAWAIDHIQGPEPVLAMLCENARIHVTGVALKDTTPEQYNLIEAGPIQSWVTTRSYYQIRRRAEYGASAFSTSVRPTRKAQVWTDQPVDMSIKRQLLENIDGWEKEIQDIRDRLIMLKKKLDDAKKERDTVAAEKEDLENDKKAKQKAQTEYGGLPTRLEQQENFLTKAQSEVKKARERIEDLHNKHDDLLLDKGQAVLDYAKSVEGIRIAHAEVIEAEIAYLEAKSDYEVLSERNKTVKERLETMRTGIQRLNKVVSECEKVAKEMHKEVMALTDVMGKDEALGKFIRSYNDQHPDLTVQSLEDDIGSEQAKLDLMHEGDGSIIARFEERAKKIDKLRDRLAKIEEGLAETDGKIAELKARWEPELDRLVALISDSFAFNMQQINCAGQVGVHKAGNEFDDWAISIQVKFRESEPLSQLDAHRQSGGERAVSTIFYLMALQALTRSPFRVVDEINQGMDPRNERLVHARMVAIATGTDDWRPPENLLRPTAAAAAADGRRRRGGDANSDDISDNDDQPVIRADTDAEDDDDADNAPAQPQMRAADGGTGIAGAAGSQYFLITPKLLHELKYEEGMKVLCIASGELMDDYANADPKSHAVSFEKAIAIRKSMAQRRTATVGA